MTPRACFGIALLGLLALCDAGDARAQDRVAQSPLSIKLTFQYTVDAGAEGLQRASLRITSKDVHVTRVPAPPPGSFKTVTRRELSDTTPELLSDQPRSLLKGFPLTDQIFFPTPLPGFPSARAEQARFANGALTAQKVRSVLGTKVTFSRRGDVIRADVSGTLAASGKTRESDGLLLFQSRVETIAGLAQLEVSAPSAPGGPSVVLIPGLLTGTLKAGAEKLVPRF